MKNFEGVRICRWCLTSKPDRCHHCRECNSCVLKMDHHCQWLATCIGFYNYKFFFNTIFHCACTNWLIVITSNSLLSHTLSNLESINIVFAYFIMTSYILSCALAVLITALLGFHVYLIANEYTTIEFKEKIGKSVNSFHSKKPFNRGICQNFRSALGNNPIFWLVPFFPNYEGEGIKFQLNY